ncbi:hypothetical protein ACJX0J_025238, partial [Zea mays]
FTLYFKKLFTQILNLFRTYLTLLFWWNSREVHALKNKVLLSGYKLYRDNNNLSVNYNFSRMGDCSCLESILKDPSLILVTSYRIVRYLLEPVLKYLWHFYFNYLPIDMY